MLDADGLTPAQRERRRKFYEEIGKGHSVPKEYEGLTKEQAKEDLRRSIQEKLDAINSYGRATEEMKSRAVKEGNSEEIVSKYTQRIDVEEIMSKISEENEQKRASFEESSKSRRERHKKMMEEQAKMEPVVLEDAVIAPFGKQDPESSPSPEPEIETPKTIEEIKAALPSYADMDITLTPLEGQVAMRDINEEIRKEHEKEEKEKHPDPKLTEIPLKEAIKESDVYGDKVFVVVLKGLEHAWEAVKGFFTRLAANIQRTVTRITAKKDPEKAVKLSKSIGSKKASLTVQKKAAKGKLGELKNFLISKEEQLSSKLAQEINKFVSSIAFRPFANDLLAHKHPAVLSENILSVTRGNRVIRLSLFHLRKRGPGIFRAQLFQCFFVIHIYIRAIFEFIRIRRGIPVQFRLF